MLSWGFISQLVRLKKRITTLFLLVFVPERDLVAGTVEHAASCNIIQERCKKVIAVFSSSFFQSKENRFLTDFAQYVGIQQGLGCKIIPIILHPEIPCDIPSQFKMYSKLAYKPYGKMFNFWDRLIVRTLGVKGPLSKELTEYKNYSAQIQPDDSLQKPDDSGVPTLNINANQPDYAESTISSSTIDRFRFNSSYITF